MARMKNAIFFIIGIFIALILVQYYFHVSTAFMSLVYHVRYYIAVTGLLIVFLVLSRRVSVSRAPYLVLFMILLSISFWYPLVHQWQTKNALVTANEIVSRVESYFVQQKKYPEKLEEVFGDDVPGMYVFMLPSRFEYLKDSKFYTLSFWDKSGMIYIYYPSYKKWIRTDDY